MLGGDWIPLPLPDRLRSIAPNVRVIALGAATESSIHSTLFEVPDVDPTWTSVPYGRPMANQRTYILDQHLAPVPAGVAGELHLAGVGLAAGYLGQPDRTAERFITWSYGPVHDERLYRTGDLAKYHPDGHRTAGTPRFPGQDTWCPHRTRRNRSPSAWPSACRRRGRPRPPHRGSDPHLVGYLVARHPHHTDTPDIDTAELRAYLAKSLPPYMVPTTFVVLDALPLNVNGKINRTALPDTPVTGVPPTAGTREQAPQGYWETRIAAVWADALRLSQVHRDDDFFDLGDDSLSALRCMSRIDRTMKWSVIYTHPTVRTLGAHLQASVSRCEA